MGGIDSRFFLGFSYAHDLDFCYPWEPPDPRRQLEHLYRDLRAAGTTWWRPHLCWNRVEPRLLEVSGVEEYASAARWHDVDLMVDGAAEAGVRLAVVLGAGYSVQLPSTGTGRLLPDAVGRSRYLERASLHARAVVRRYRGKVAVWQLENELNIAGECTLFGWRHGRAWWSRSFQDDLIRVLHEAVRAEDPGARTTHNICAELKHVPGVYSWKADVRRWARFMDVIGIDAYPNYLLGWPNRAAVVAEKVREALAAAGGKPVAVLESGYPVAPARRLFSEERQAEYYASLIPAVREAGASGLFLYALTSPEAGRDDPRWEGKGERFPQAVERHWGVVRDDGTFRPAFEAVRANSARHQADDGRHRKG